MSLPGSSLFVRRERDRVQRRFPFCFARDRCGCTPTDCWCFDARMAVSTIPSLLPTESKFCLRLLLGGGEGFTLRSTFTLRRFVLASGAGRAVNVCGNACSESRRQETSRTSGLLPAALHVTARKAPVHGCERRGGRCLEAATLRRALRARRRLGFARRGWLARVGDKLAHLLLGQFRRHPECSPGWPAGGCDLDQEELSGGARCPPHRSLRGRPA